MTHLNIIFNLSELMINDHVNIRVGYQTLNVVYSSFGFEYFSPHSEPPDCRNNRRGRQRNLRNECKFWKSLLECSDGNVQILERK